MTDDSGQCRRKATRLHPSHGPDAQGEKSGWQSALGALQVEDDAEDDERYNNPGYTTEYEASEADDEDFYDDSPVEADSPVVSGSDADSPVVSNDDYLDSPSPVGARSPVYGSSSESEEFDSD